MAEIGGLPGLIHYGGQGLGHQAHFCMTEFPADESGIWPAHVQKRTPSVTGINSVVPRPLLAVMGGVLMKT